MAADRLPAFQIFIAALRAAFAESGGEGPAQVPFELSSNP